LSSRDISAAPFQAMVWDRRRKYTAYGMELEAILNKMTQEEGDSIPTEFQ